MIISSTPSADGYRMPAEWEKQHGCIMVWPSRPGSWPFGAIPARKAFKQIIDILSQYEKVYLAAGKDCIDDARMQFADKDNVVIFPCETDDAWARDIGPTFVVDREQNVRAVNWEFNAWGGTYNGLYTSWDKDNAFAKYFADKFGYDIYDAAPFVLEGGSIHSDGEGTVLVTESCLLSRGRNPALSRDEIAELLCKYLGARKVIWLPRGIYMDETDEHVDNVCSFVAPAKVVLAWPSDENDPQYELSKACLDVLNSEVDAKGRPFVVHKLPIPDKPILVCEEDLLGYEFEDGEDAREVGDRLAASYVNFYVGNNVVLYPAFGGDNKESDERAGQILRECFPDRKICSVFARDILAGGGNIHCITQQIPLGKD